MSRQSQLNSHLKLKVIPDRTYGQVQGIRDRLRAQLAKVK
jgi:hypothetical protein